MGAVSVNLKLPQEGEWFAVTRVDDAGGVLPVCYLSRDDFDALAPQMEELAGPCNFDLVPGDRDTGRPEMNPDRRITALLDLRDGPHDGLSGPELRKIVGDGIAAVADALMPWVAANATVWPSQHATHEVLMNARRDERGRAQYLVGRLDDALRDLDPEYVNSPLEIDEVRPFLADSADEEERHAA